MKYWSAFNIIAYSISNYVGSMVHDPEQDCTNESNNEDLELPLFDFATIADATNHFSMNNKLGQGGFGPVYKVST